MAKTEIFTLGLDGAQYLKVATQLQKKIVELTNEQRLLTKNGMKSSQGFVQNAADLKDLRGSYNSALKGITEYNKQQIATADYSKSVNKELRKEVNTINEAKQQITRLNKVKKSLNVNNKEEKKLLDDINKRIDENTSFVKDNSSSVEKQKMNIGNYVSALDGVSPRLKGWITQIAFIISSLKAKKIALMANNDTMDDVSSSSSSAAKSSKILTLTLKAQDTAVKASSNGFKYLKIAIASTGIGLLLIAVVALAAAFKKSQPLIDKVNVAFAGIGAVVNVIIDRFIKVGEVLSNVFNQSLFTTINGVTKSFVGMGDEMEREVDLFMELERASQRLRDLEIEQTANQAERLVAVEKLRFAAKDELATIDERVGKLKAAQVLERLTMKEQVANAQERYRIFKADVDNTNTTVEDRKKLAELQADISRVAVSSLKKERTLEAELQSLQKRGRTKEAAESKKHAANKVVQSKKELDEAVSNFNIELEKFKINNEVKLQEDDKLNQNFVKSKLAYLQTVQAMEQGMLVYKLQNGLIKENEYNLSKLQLETDYQNQKAELLQTITDKEKADNIAKQERDRENRQIEFELKLEETALNKETEYEQKLEIEQLQYDNDKAILEDRLKDKEITQDQHDRSLEILKAKHLDKITKITEQASAHDKKIEELKQKAKLDGLSTTFNNVSELIGKETALGKASAIAATTIDTYQSAVSAYKGMVKAIPGPVGIAAGAVAAALSVATGLATVKKIVSVKKPDTPKAEKGALFNIGGKRHSQGGTKFQGEDGTSFEAEKGELIGVMSRQASQKFKAFNDYYTDGVTTDSSYLESGGIVSTSSAVSNVSKGNETELFAKILAEEVNKVQWVNNVNDTETLINDNNEVKSLANI